MPTASRVGAGIGPAGGTVPGRVASTIALADGRADAAHGLVPGGAGGYPSARHPARCSAAGRPQRLGATEHAGVASAGAEATGSAGSRSSSLRTGWMPGRQRAVREGSRQRLSIRPLLPGAWCLVLGAWCLVLVPGLRQPRRAVVASGRRMPFTNCAETPVSNPAGHLLRCLGAVLMLLATATRRGPWSAATPPGGSRAPLSRRLRSRYRPDGGSATSA